jgi:beta-lysine 5,6-aminomutase beta subunit
VSAASAQASIVRPYGDTTGDGMVQVSFTLPLPHDERAEGAALQLAHKMGLQPALLVHAKAMGPSFTFFVVYGRSRTWSTSTRCRCAARVPAAARPKRSTRR